MVIDYKMLLLVLIICWLGPGKSIATPANSMPVAGDRCVAKPEGFRSFNTFFNKNKRPRHYVIIGAFRELENANKLIRRVASVGFDPKYFLNKDRGLYYVYIVIHDDLRSAHRVSAKLRDIRFIKDAWVFSTETGEPISERLIASADPKSGVLLNDAGSQASVKSTGATSGTGNQETKENKNIAPPPSQENAKPVKNKPTPKQETANTTFKPTSSTAINQLSQAGKGDIIIFDDLLFHKNSSVLRKVSKEEMARLNEVLKVKSNLRIKIHGHTNGDFKGEVYLLAESDDRFFKLSGKNKVVKGDDKLLSSERAQVIKRYLSMHGIKAERIETQGWGDRRMLYPKGHLKAPLNRRVEIEILEN